MRLADFAGRYDLSRLPKWVVRLINRLESDIDFYQSKMEETILLEDAKASWRVLGTGLMQGVPEGAILEIHPMGRNGPRLELHLHKDRTGRWVVLITAGESAAPIRVEPWGSEIQLYLREWEGR